MPQKQMDWDTVRRIARRLPEVEESTAYGSPALKVRGKLLACIPTHRSAEPGSVAVRIDLERRAGLLEDAPEVYYVKDHYVNYPVVLVRLARIQPEALQELLGAAWRFVTSRSLRGKRSGGRSA